MEYYLRYLLIATIGLSILYGSYRLFLKHETRFRHLRLYLLLSVFIALVVPFYTAEISLSRPPEIVKEEQFESNKNLVLEIPVSAQPTESIDENFKKRNFSWQEVIFYIYLTGLICIILRLLIYLISILKMIRKSHCIESGPQKVLANSGINHSFTFFNWILIPAAVKDNKKYSEIITHEKIHASQLHSIDVVIMELLSAVMWFNPLVWMMKKSVQLVHEYLADEGVLCTGADKLRYQALLVNQVAEERLICLSSGFNQSLIKKRLVMMTQKTKHRKNRYSLLPLIPAVILLLFGMACLNGQQVQNDENKFTVVIDAGHGGKDNGAEANGLFEKDLTLQLANLLEEASKQSKDLQIINLRTKDEFIDLNTRVERINEIQPDLLIMLHFNNNKNNENVSGIECIVDRESAYNKISRGLAGKFALELAKLDGLKGKNDVYESSLLVLRESDCPGICMNLGFLSNQNDAAYLLNPKNVKQISDNILNTLAHVASSWENIVEASEYERKTVTAVALTKMNVLYLGVKNPANIAISGVDPKDIDVAISNGRIEGENGEYIIMPRRPGNCLVKVYTVKNGVRNCVDEYEYRVKTVPDPVAVLDVKGKYKGAYKKSGEITKEKLLTGKSVRATIENFDFDLNFSVVSFAVSTTQGGYVYEHSSKSNLITDEQKSLFQKAEIGQRIYIQDIKAVGPDGTERTLPTIMFKITG